MAWQYEEPYPGYPYLTDWAGKEFQFGIQMSDTPIGQTIETTEIKGREVTLVETHTDGILRPSFYFAGNKTDRPYHLNLNLLNGLSRVVYSTSDQGTVGPFRAIDLRTRKLGIGGFEDFQAIGRYALERLPKIAQEIVLPPADFPDDIPEDEIENILKYREQCLSVVDWDATQKEIARGFCSLFGTFVLAARGEPGVGLIHRKGDDKFTPQQMQELSTLIEPLG